MSFIEMEGLQDAKEAIVAPEGNYELVILQATHKPEKNNITVLLEIDSDEDYGTVFHTISLPKKDDDEDKRKAKGLFAKRFLVQFDLDTGEDGFNLEAFSGQRASCNITQSVYEGTTRNQIRLDNLPQ